MKNDHWAVVGQVTLEQRKKASELLEAMGCADMSLDRRNEYATRCILTINDFSRSLKTRYVAVDMFQIGKKIVFIIPKDQVDFKELDIIRLQWTNHNGVARVTKIRKASRQSDPPDSLTIYAEFTLEMIY